MCQLMFGVVREAVGRGQRQLRCDVEFDVGFQPVPDPAHPHPAHRPHTRLPAEHVVGGVDEGGVDAVQEPAEHIAGRDDQHHRMAAAISRPMIGSAAGKPSATPTAPATTANDVNPSVRACRPSATSAADPIRLPTRMRYSATSSLPTNPTTPAAATQPRCAAAPDR